ncbi:50S ribosomal protein L33 [Bacillus coahuilensis]|nr:50S ribosomal protein L33 [Bacillus coahuilensis]
MSQKQTLECSTCGSRNYSTPKKEQQGERLEVKKYCKHCNAHTLHKQTK